MLIFDHLTADFMPFLPTIFTVMGVGILLWILYWLLIGRHHDVGKERKFPRQIILLGVMLAGILVTILVLPISESSRNQLIGLIGLLISGIVAFSSTNIISNFMAGILLRITTPFRTGDFVRVGDHFGRVSERGLFDTEIQTETRELVALPNTYLTNNPVTTIRSSGTIISVSLSLGYDVHHCQVESLLIKAAEKCGLEEPFVHILDMANYSVTYRVSGLLMDVKKIISVRSNLFQCVLDTLHDGGIEIASPTIMNQRQIEKDRKIMPMAMHTTSTNVNVNAEEIAFDKAELAEQMENEKEKLTQTIQELEAELKNASENDKIRIKEKIKKCSERLNHLNTDKVETISAQK